MNFAHAELVRKANPWPAEQLPLQQHGAKLEAPSLGIALGKQHQSLQGRAKRPFRREMGVGI